MTDLPPIVLALLGTIFPAFSTMLGASCVFIVKKTLNIKYEKIFLGCAAGIMISSSIWSLLIPSIEMSEKYEINTLITIIVGFLLGALSLKFLDKTMKSFESKNDNSFKPSLRRTTLMVLSVTLHNIPEGIAIGVAFSLGVSENSIGSLAGAIALSIAMVLQNFPEGVTLSLPLKKEGVSNIKSFFIASIPGLVEPIGGIIGVFLATKISFIMPLILAFAAGAMILVVVDELIPECNSHRYKNYGTIGFMLGFVLMLILDIILK